MKDPAVVLLDAMKGIQHLSNVVDVGGVPRRTRS
ncbi:hypothetical protein A8926_4991 [Saccharopolyspora spinosa]|uniref:Uncharacterized protein n=1 Tax=Saccharopolyspora spinosa TaxID=60894 RepID=A0A2N3Y2A7_SACSN|nr:hypothetical protein A8926_4991 [Saccharopolyspora spinosa]